MLIFGWARLGRVASFSPFKVANSVQANNYARAGEPDLFLVVTYPKIYDTAEELRQQKEFEAFMKSDARGLAKQFAARSTMRKPMGQQQLRQLKLK